VKLNFKSSLVFFNFVKASVELFDVTIVGLMFYCRTNETFAEDHYMSYIYIYI